MPWRWRGEFFIARKEHKIENRELISPEEARLNRNRKEYEQAPINQKIGRMAFGKDLLLSDFHHGGPVVDQRVATLSLAGRKRQNVEG